MDNRIWHLASPRPFVVSFTAVCFTFPHELFEVPIYTFPEHLGLIEPQWCVSGEEVTSFMRPAPISNQNELGSVEDEMVADPLSDETDRLWNDTAKSNRDIFTECFRPIPTNLIRTWDAYEVRHRRWSPLGV